jgi:hypothetical protein
VGTLHSTASVSGGSWPALDKTEELLAGNIGAHPVRHRGGKVLGGLEAQAAVVLRVRKSSERRGQEREEKEEDGKATSRTSARHVVLKGADTTPHF